MQIEVSNGEIVDKFTILQIKKDKIKDAEKLVNVNREIEVLEPIVASIPYHLFDYKDLISVNSLLWEVEDALRLHEEQQNFNEQFIKLARYVYKLNDVRASIKKKININTNSELTEEKSYQL
jgi:hypothetical protein